ncbi:recombinase RecA [[Clostridium] innocuum]|uniref:recombinase RecA n=1 Tax=Clostridium innocuum TaxID=1522 RepID=UPI000D6AA982|nr:recombinase RecA [[Clostridium] innocuum]MCR0315276.1 recombinase RecA [[Clostridium] innocuum]MCR0369702.1 recombinase RecA [[Clostridium] innocuum]MCR0374786.1 recombinase RecA [[Clostridium] innocuum]MCR0559655.1 recombinase RecA [[Clostridium] innocuum]MCR0602651.1 recombinase RecA [[Clostridium] innocuum]
MDENITKLVKDLEKKYGKGVVVDTSAIPEKFPCYSSGSIHLDKILGGGYPKKRIVEIYGPEASGKTTLALHAVAEVQKIGENVGYIDVENALDASYATRLGVNMNDMILSQPDSGEQALDVVEALAKSGLIRLIIIDSVAALVPQAELDGEMGDMNMGLQARMMSKAMRKLSRIVNEADCTLIFINQIREKIGVMYGNPETTTGGRALGFYSSIRLDVRKGEAIKNGSEFIGHKLNVKTAKNKLYPPFKTTKLDVIYGKGINLAGEILDKAVELGIVEKTGAWYSYNGERLGQGRENAYTYIQENDLLQVLKDTISKDENKAIEA